MFLLWLLLSLSLSYLPVIAVMFMKDVGYVCMAAHASVWTTVHLCWKTWGGRSRGSTRRLQNPWQILMKLIKRMSPFYFYTVESLRACKIKITRARETAEMHAEDKISVKHDCSSNSQSSTVDLCLSRCSTSFIIEVWAQRDCWDAAFMSHTHNSVNQCERKYPGREISNYCQQTQIIRVPSPHRSENRNLKLTPILLTCVCWSLQTLLK